MNVALVVCTDLFFAVKIDDAAKRAGIQPKFLKSRDSLVEAARGGAALVVLDLNCRDVDAASLLRDLASDPATAHIPAVAFVSHVQTELIRSARETGYGRVLARSAFVKELPELMRAAAQSNQ